MGMDIPPVRMRLGRDGNQVPGVEQVVQQLTIAGWRKGVAVAALLLALCVALAAPSGASARDADRLAPPKLHGYVTAFGLSIRSCATCPKLRKVPAGRYELILHDSTTRDNFHLTGPGVDLATDVDDTTPVRGQDMGTITLSKGEKYTFFSDERPEDGSSFSVSRSLRHR